MYADLNFKPVRIIYTTYKLLKSKWMGLFMLEIFCLQLMKD